MKLVVPARFGNVKVRYEGINYPPHSEKATYSEEHVIELDNGKRKGKVKFNLPILLKDGRLYHKEQYYFPIPCICKPILIHDKERDEIIIKNLLTDFIKNSNYDMCFRISKRKDLYFRLENNINFRYPTKYELEKFVISTKDRLDLNRFLNLSEIKNHLTESDISRIEEILLDPSCRMINTDWRDFSNIRISTIDRMLSMVISMNLPHVIYHFQKKGVIYSNIIEKACERYISESSQCQHDNTDTEISKIAIREKVVLPITEFGDINAAKQHENWIGIIDGTNTPQSEKCGSVVSLCSGVSIENDQFIKRGNHIYSNLMRRSLLFPLFLAPHRQIMVSAAAKQCCDLGENNQNQIIKVDDTDDIPDLKGRNVSFALMDWNFYTHEDACVISESLAKKLSTKKKTEYIFFDLGGKPTIIINEDDLVRSHAIVGFYSSEEEMRMSNKIRGRINKIEHFREKIDGKLAYAIRITIECQYDCVVGSKLSNLHSCKSIVSKILPDYKMPTLMNGEFIEMILSPSVIGNRINPSFMIEGMLGIYCSVVNAELYINQFDDTISFEWAASKLRSCNLPEDCKFQLRNGKEGKKFEHKTFVGISFFMRLHHHADEKMKACSNSSLDQRGLPSSRFGNTKFGREEIEVLYQHECEGIIQEIKDNSSKSSSKDLIQGMLKTVGYQYHN